MAHGSGTRERILGVSKTLFAARGYEHASTSSIARQAGTSESQLMKHFGNKAGLLEAIFAQTWSKITADSREAVKDIPAPLQKLTTVSEIVVTTMERDPELKLLMLLEGRRIRREGQIITLTQGFLDFIALVDGILEELRTNGQLKPGLKPQAIRSALMGMMEGMLRDRFLAERLDYPAQFDAQEIGNLLVITLASCIVPKSAEAA